MRWIIYISIVSLFSFGNALVAQQTMLDQKVSAEFSETEIKAIIQHLSSTYHLNFSYSESNVPIHQKATINAHNTPLGEVLDQLLGAASMSYQLIMDQIVLITMKKGASDMKLYGIVFDRSNNRIPFASIGVKNSSTGTSTNAEGEFVLKLPELPVQISVSHISHDKSTVTIEDTNDTVKIYLSQAIKTLQGITIRGKKNDNGLYRMVQNASKQLQKSALTKKYGKAFYRQKSKRNDHYTEIFEIFFDAQYNSNGIEDWEVMEGRYALKSEENQHIFLYNRNFSLLSKILTLGQPSTDTYLMPVQPEVRKYFNLDLEEVLKYGKRDIAVIHFDPKETNGVSSCAGYLYIDIRTHEIIKISGTFNDDSINLLQFSHKKGDWKDFNLVFEISFQEDPTGELRLDHIKVAHKFDYYHGNEFHGSIQTDSYLVFYEHYTPIEHKHLGGKLNINYSDVQVLDGLGYNRVFWEENPVVKRTPTEKRVIEEFENSLAFGSVYLNQEQLISYLPKYTADSISQIIVKKYFDNTKTQLPDEKVYLRLIQDYAKPGGMIHFNGFVLNFSNHVPSVLSSTLNVEVIDHKGIVQQTAQFDLNRGAVHGSIIIPHHLEDGEYQLYARTNRSNSVSFNRRFYLLSKDYYYPNQLNVNPVVDRLPLEIRASMPLKQPICHRPTPVSFQILDKKNNPVSMEAYVLDKNFLLIDTLNTNSLGTGLINYGPGNNKNIYLSSPMTEDTLSIQLPACTTEGISVIIDQTHSKNLIVNIHNNGAFSPYVYIGTSKFGVIQHLFKQNILKDVTTIEIPKITLPSEVYELKVFSMHGDMIYSKQMVNPNPKLFQVRLSSHGKYRRRQNTVPLQLEIMDEDGNPVEGHFVISTYTQTSPENPEPEIEIQNFLNLKPILKESYEQYRKDLNELPDTESMAGLDQLLSSFESYSIEILDNKGQENKIKRRDLDHDIVMHEQTVEMAELNMGVASGTGAEEFRNTSAKKMESSPSIFSTWKNVAWIPGVFTDHLGKTAIELRTIPDVDNCLLIVEGVSKEGDIIAIKTILNVRQPKNIYSATNTR